MRSGKITYADGSVYEGSFLNNARHGQGILKTDFFLYRGEFVDD